MESIIGRSGRGRGSDERTEEIRRRRRDEAKTGEKTEGETERERRTWVGLRKDRLEKHVGEDGGSLDSGCRGTGRRRCRSEERR